MKGKLLENIVLTVGLLLIGSAVFLMYFATTPEAAKSVNIIFASGFVIYIIYNYIMASKLKGEIYELKKIIENLKEEVGRLTNTIAKRDQTIKETKAELADVQESLKKSEENLAATKQELDQTKLALSDAQDQLAKKGEE